MELLVGLVPGGGKMVPKKTGTTRFLPPAAFGTAGGFGVAWVSTMAVADPLGVGTPRNWLTFLGRPFPTVLRVNETFTADEAHSMVASSLV